MTASLFLFMKSDARWVPWRKSSIFYIFVLGVQKNIAYEFTNATQRFCSLLYFNAGSFVFLPGKSSSLNRRSFLFFVICCVLSMFHHSDQALLRLSKEKLVPVYCTKYRTMTLRMTVQQRVIIVQLKSSFQSYDYKVII